MGRTLSIIIPTYNEESTIAGLIRYLREVGFHPAIRQIIVADGQSTDDTIRQASQAGGSIVLARKKGRASQMNAGAAVATGDILYFLHADSFPPPGFADDILRAVQQGYGSGCYQLDFDHSHWFLRANCWFTRFNVNAVRFGDQSLFVTRSTFQKVSGFREDLVMMEDQEVIKRIREHTRFIVLNNRITTSARKYLENGIYRMQTVFYLIWTLYQLGYSQECLVNTYRRLIRQDKI